MNQLKILVVDDDPTTRTILEKKLKKVGHGVETANNGDEAVGFISKYNYDVIITDLMMPGGVDGIGVLEKTKAMHNRTDVILVTAHATINNAVKAMKKGAVDYLQKPINFDELMLRLEKINAIKSLAKDANDLREAMDVTEITAAQTIQSQELMISELYNKFSEIKGILSKWDMEYPKRVKLAMEILSSVTG